MWWPENDDLSGGGDLLKKPGRLDHDDPPTDEPGTEVVPPPSHPVNVIDDANSHPLRGGARIHPPISGSGDRYSGLRVESETMSDFGDDEAEFGVVDKVGQDKNEDDDAESFAGGGGPGEEDPSIGVRQRIYSGGEGSSEHHDTLAPLSGDIETGGISGLGQYPETQAPAAAEPNRDSGRKLSKGIDLATGKTCGGTREHYARIRSRSSGVPLSPGSRRNRALTKFFRPSAEEGASQELDRRKQFALQKDQQKDEEVWKSSLHGRIMVSTRNWDATATQASSQHRPFGGSQHNSGREKRVYEPGVGESLVQSEGRQYRLQAVSARDRAEGTFWFNLLTCFGCGRTYNIYDDPNDANMANSRWSTNAFVIRYLHWTFRSSFAAVFVSSLIVYFFVISVFALGIWSIAVRRPGCVGGVEIKANAKSFSDCWQLSFNTFSTTGYGVVFAGNSATVINVHACTGMSILTSLEAYYGMLFGSICCAILFARIGRAQSYAQVLFSDPIVIRFGRGAAIDGGSEEFEPEEESSDDTKEGDTECIPCPILEFRLANRMSGVVGGEIMDATMNVIASIDADQACPTILRAASFRRRSKKGRLSKRGGNRNKRRSSKRPGTVPPLPEDKIMENYSSLASSLGDSSGSNRADRTAAAAQLVEEDPTGSLSPRRIFSKLDVDPQEHPFFKRVWVVRHVLDQESPLLKAHARQMVCRNGGFWPHELNSYDGVRAAVSFDQVLVSMTGTSNADANTVYSQKVYDFADVSVGYRFANMLYRDNADSSLQVDLRLLNDVTEQAGGGGEPLDGAKVESKGNAMML